MGSLSLATPSASIPSVDGGTIETPEGVERLHGKKLDTELHIVLQNITAGFTRPNVLDLKLGAQLWDEGASEEKRARLDKVSGQTTSGSLGFRIAGMRTWVGSQAGEVEEELKPYVEFDKEGGYYVYNKMYGRKFSAENVREGFEAYIYPAGKGGEREMQRAREVLAFFLGEVKDIVEVFERKESRMYSASILLVYEGDVDAYEGTKEKLRGAPEEDEEDEEAVVPQLAAVKMIDFAHATWRAGEGKDENALRGMRSTVGVLKGLLDEVEREE